MGQEEVMGARGKVLTEYQREAVAMPDDASGDGGPDRQSSGSWPLCRAAGDERCASAPRRLLWAMGDPVMRN